MDPIDGIGEVKNNGAVAPARPISFGGQGPGATTAAAAAPPTDSFHPSDEIKEEQQAGAGGAGGRNKADNESDARLFNQAGSCGEGCSCAACVGQGEDSSKAFEKRDKEVRDHEQAHLSTAGENAIGGPTFDTVTAKNGKSYAMGGKVQVQVKEVPNDPQKTIQKMQQIQKAALAPVEPSSQDRHVAAEAQGKEQEARADQNKREASKGHGGQNGAPQPPSAGGVPQPTAVGAVGSTSTDRAG